MKIQGESTCDSLLATQNAHFDKELPSHHRRFFMVALGGLDYLGLTYDTEVLPEPLHNV